MVDYFVSILSQNPNFNLFLASVGALRLVVKPLMSGLRLVANQTPTATDNKMLDEVEASNAYKSVLYVLDWLTSVKSIKG